MSHRMRALAGDDDDWRLRGLLWRAIVANGLRERSPHVARLDLWWWFAVNRLYASIMGRDHGVSEPWELAR